MNFIAIAEQRLWRVLSPISQLEGFRRAFLGDKTDTEGKPKVVKTAMTRSNSETEASSIVIFTEKFFIKVRQFLIPRKNAG